MKLAAHLLTFIAEDLGKRNPPPVSYLDALSRHLSAVVREGAVYGLAYCLPHPKAREILNRLAVSDVNDIVRNCAVEALEP